MNSSSWGCRVDSAATMSRGASRAAHCDAAATPAPPGDPPGPLVGFCRGQGARLEQQWVRRPRRECGWLPRRTAEHFFEFPAGDVIKPAEPRRQDCLGWQRRLGSPSDGSGWPRGSSKRPRCAAARAAGGSRTPPRPGSEETIHGPDSRPGRSCLVSLALVRGGQGREQESRQGGPGCRQPHAGRQSAVAAISTKISKPSNPAGAVGNGE